MFTVTCDILKSSGKLGKVPGKLSNDYKAIVSLSTPIIKLNYIFIYIVTEKLSFASGLIFFLMEICSSSAAIQATSTYTHAILLTCKNMATEANTTSCFLLCWDDNGQ